MLFSSRKLRSLSFFKSLKPQSSQNVFHRLDLGLWYPRRGSAARTAPSSASFGANASRALRGCRAPGPAERPGIGANSRLSGQHAPSPEECLASRIGSTGRARLGTEAPLETVGFGPRTLAGSTEKWVTPLVSGYRATFSRKRCAIWLFSSRISTHVRDYRGGEG